MADDKEKPVEKKEEAKPTPQPPSTDELSESDIESVAGGGGGLQHGTTGA